jgi:hypothetical protein
MMNAVSPDEKPLVNAGAIHYGAAFDQLHRGALAQLGERLHGMQEVASSILVSSTNFLKLVLKIIDHGKIGRLLFDIYYDMLYT